MSLTSFSAAVAAAAANADEGAGDEVDDGDNDKDDHSSSSADIIYTRASSSSTTAVCLFSNPLPAATGLLCYMCDGHTRCCRQNRWCSVQSPSSVGRTDLFESARKYATHRHTSGSIASRNTVEYSSRQKHALRRSPRFRVTTSRCTAWWPLQNRAFLDNYWLQIIAKRSSSADDLYPTIV